MSEDWTEKYRPDGLSRIIGNPKAVSDLRGWAASWNSGTPDKRAAVLMGSPGVGKTSAAIALANEMGWDLVEMNASDQRTGDAIRSVALKGANFNTFSDSGSYLDVKEGGRKLIVLDEADNLFGREDRGALPAISELIRSAKQPVILIVNDFYELSRKSDAIKSGTLQITFMRPRSTEIVKALGTIAKSENISVSEEALSTIA
ncbi:MAG: AAA family ATPase [Methanomassiliicoccaceae archaeon]|nr:AAA family ATPase [Methanomassiliicoccaceae archaeon]